MGVVVGTVAVSMFLPLFDLTAAGPHAGGGAP
jgi:type II secretory pathway component PulF